MNDMAALSSEQPDRTSALEEYDVLILGGRTGSTVAAWTFAGQGQRVTVIERKYIGGSCPNIACLPSKNILKALVEVNGDRILGFTAFAVDGGEIMASVQTAMMAGLPYTALRDAIWSHPTLVEGLIALFSAAPSLSAGVEAQAADRLHYEIVG
jgi:pyruvate/2-oxoglutarate dehydrogenase complex dihydrolipoamide dehydrogenase (E3) component